MSTRTYRVFDIETNGVDGDIIHCLTYKDLSPSSSPVSFHGTEVRRGVDELLSADVLIGHYITGFDLPFIERVYNIYIDIPIIDTYVLSYMSSTSRRHGLEAYGELIGVEKPKHEDWTSFSPAMLHRNREDVEITIHTLSLLLNELRISKEEVISSYVSYIRQQKRGKVP